MTPTFRALESTNSQTRKDEIVIAAVSAFASRTRPTRLDANLLEDLVLPTLPHTADATRRMASACLSDLPHAPHRIVMRLCEEKVDICAALLLRSPVLQDADLISLIEKNGIPFARVIARRATLTHKIRALLLALGDSIVATIVTNEKLPVPTIHPEIKADRAEISAKLEAARDALRNMMREQIDVPNVEPERLTAQVVERPVKVATRPEPQQIAAKLRATAFLPDEKFFVTALADVHGLSFERAKRVLQRSAPSELMTALHAGGVSTADAFVIISAFYPELSKDKAEIALFLTRYDALQHDQTLTNVRRWKAEEISNALRAKPANFVLPQRELKAS